MNYKMNSGQKLRRKTNVFFVVKYDSIELSAVNVAITAVQDEQWAKVLRRKTFSLSVTVKSYQ